jgi:hypothetical protein
MLDVWTNMVELTATWVTYFSLGFTGFCSIQSFIAHLSLISNFIPSFLVRWLMLQPTFLSSAVKLAPV